MLFYLGASVYGKGGEYVLICKMNCAVTKAKAQAVKILSNRAVTVKIGEIKQTFSPGC